MIELTPYSVGLERPEFTPVERLKVSLKQEAPPSIGRRGDHSFSERLYGLRRARKKKQRKYWR